MKPILDQSQVAGKLDDMYVGEPSKKMTQFTGSTPVPPGYDPTGRPWYLAASNSQEAIATAPYIDAATKKPIITFAKALRKDGQLVAVAVTSPWHGWPTKWCLPSCRVMALPS
jgi:methyl-accepting chemotaxis protein